MDPESINFKVVDPQENKKQTCATIESDDELFVGYIHTRGSFDIFKEEWKYFIPQIVNSFFPKVNLFLKPLNFMSNQKQ